MTIKEIKQQSAGLYKNMEVYYSNRGFLDPSYQWESIFDEGARAEIIKNTHVNMDDMEAAHFELMGEEEYDNCVLPNVSISFCDMYDKGDKILVIMLNRRSYEILSNPNVIPLKEALAKYGDNYAETIVVVPDKDPRVTNDSIIDYEAYWGESLNVIRIKDNMYVNDAYTLICGENDIDTMSYHIDHINEWHDEESFEEHYGSPDSKILILFAV